MRGWRALRRACASIALATPLAAAAQLELDAIAVGGQPAPDSPPGWLQTEVHGPVQNRRGDLAFSGGRSSGATWGNALWRTTTDGALEVVFQQGDPAPGAPTGARFYSFAPLLLSEQGHLLFFASLDAGPGVTADNDEGVWGPDGAGGFTMWMREGDPAPGSSPSTTFLGQGQFFGRGVSGAGIFVIEARRDPGPGSPPDWGLFAGAPGGPVELLIGTGDPVPDVPGAEFHFPGVSTFGALDDAGRFVTWGRLRVGPGGVTEADDDVILEIGPAGVVSLLAREGGAAPEPPGAVFDHVGWPVAGNPAGLVAYQGRLRAGVAGVTSGDDEVSVLRHPAGTQEVVRYGGLVAPDLPGAIPFDVLSVYGIAPSGLRVLKGTLSVEHPAVTPDSSGVVYAAELEGALRLVARRQGVSSIWVNGPGDVAYVALDGQGVAEEIVFHPHDGGPAEGVQRGDAFEIAPGELRTIEGFESFAYGRPLLDDRRALVFEVRFLADDGLSVESALLRAGLPPAAQAVPGAGRLPVLLAALVVSLLAVPLRLRARAPRTSARA